MSDKVASSNEVLPDEGCPHISVNAPQGKPLVSSSTGAIPVLTVGGAARSGNSEAGTMRQARFPRLSHNERARWRGDSKDGDTAAETATEDGTGTPLDDGMVPARGARPEAAGMRSAVENSSQEPVRFSLFIRLADGILLPTGLVVKL
jgi:hypothetical protein